MFKAILFDLDGTLIRTMKMYLKSWQKACHDFGFEISGADYYPLEGMQANELAKTLCRAYNVDEKHIKKIVERKTAYFLGYFSQKKAELYPGVEELLNTLGRKNIKLALVTASTKEQIFASVPNAVLEKFNFIVTGEMSGRGKPYPDPYLLAAEKIGVNILNCIGVENAPLGIESIKSTGAYCIAVASTVEKEKLKDADEIFETLAEIKNSKNWPR